MPAPEPAPISRDTTLGIDVGLTVTDFATFSTGREDREPSIPEKLPSAPEGIAASGIAEKERVEKSAEINSETCSVS